MLHLKEPTPEFIYWKNKYIEAKHLSEAKIKAKKLLVKQSEEENRIYDKAYIFTRNSKGKFEIMSGTISVKQKGILRETKLGTKTWRLR